MAIMKYSAKINLYNSCFDCNNNLKAQSVLAIFQDVASHHAEFINCGYEKTLKDGLFWVLSRIKFDIVKMPEINEQVVVETWPHEKGKVDFDRDYLITNLSGEVLVKGTSKWCVIDANTRMLVRGDRVDYVGEVFDKVLYEDRFTKTANFEIENLEPCFLYTVKHSDLDHNDHMNNTYYANIALDAAANKVFNHLQINYISESKLGDVISVYVENGETSKVSGYIENRLVFIAEVY